MNNLLRPVLIICVSSLILNACADKKDTDIPLSEVPSNIISIAQNTLPGIALDEAEKHVKKGVIIYELEGKLISGEEYEIEITESGTIIKVELED